MTPPESLPDHPIRTISVPLETAIRVVVFSAGIAVAMYGSTAGIRSDVRDIATTLEMQGKLDEMKTQRQDERMQQLRTTIDDMKRRQELQQYEIQALKETILKQRAGENP